MPVILAGTLACAGTASAGSAPPMTVTITSASGAIGNYFRLTAQPGQRKLAGSLNLQNQTTHPVTVLIDPVEGLTASTLGSAYGLHGTKPKGSARWVTLGQRHVVLPPRGRSKVSVLVDVPSSAKAGDFLAGLSVEAAAATNQVELKGNVAINNVQRYAVGLETFVPGPRHPSIKLTGVDLKREPSGVTFYLDARNAGNAILQNVHGSATVSEAGGVVARRALGPGTFVTGTAIAYPLLVPSLEPTQGTAFQVSALMHYPGGVARIAKTVQFGKIDAKRQQAYGGPMANRGSGGGNHLLLILLVVGAVAAGAIAFEIRRRRSGEAALRRALPREIAHARASGEPLSVILVPVDQGQRPRRLAAVAKDSLRPRDRLYRLKNSGLMVLSPDTSPDAAEMLAVEIRRQLARDGQSGAAVIPISSAAESSAEELLEAAAAGAETGTSGNGAANGSGRGDSAQSEVKHSGKEASAVGGTDGSHNSA